MVTERNRARGRPIPPSALFPSAPSVTLRIDSRRKGEVEKRGDDLWVEASIGGQYTDVGAHAEEEILLELRMRPWRKVVETRFADHNPWLYKIITDTGRSLFLDLLPTRPNGTYLDVGSGWGQIAIPLSKYGNAFCLDLTMPRLSILRAIAVQEGVQLGYICGDFKTFPFAPNQFDLVVFNGSLEWIALGATDIPIWDVQLDALKKAAVILKPGGIVYVGIENSIGLKYLLGAPDDHSGIPYLSFLTESAARAACREQGVTLQAKTWSLQEYRALFKAAGLNMTQIYACFPDYKLIRHMIPIDVVNERLLESGLLHPEYSGVDGSPLQNAMHLDQIYRVLATAGIAAYFSPSYGFMATTTQ
jgi:SAM-dependent methyltransferase